LKELYEVFRVDSQIPLFLEDHVKRLYNGAKKSGIIIDKEPDEIIDLIYRNLSLLNIREGNIRLSFFFDSNSLRAHKFEIKLIEHHYPSAVLYKTGIDCSLLYSERTQPEAKIANKELRGKANQNIKEKNVYEVLLVNRSGEITEGSRSNVFFIKDNILSTAPSNLVLPGIIRQKTLLAAKELGIPVKFKCINADKELKYIDAAFITGTSPRILPIKSIEGLNFQPDHYLTQRLIIWIQGFIRGYIESSYKVGKNI
jgi:branched-chain amino acid aminotransferase